ncbi:galactosylceramide sulfotransferase isoform X2 [Eurytemora carolleeae]|uniref:galactosylceramide sulfotransferase isoform X2 n=1 Tax=Eurytemora carolleeae TaxID=1294199 RepID=UPI000C76C4B0|nr:galactosylceramide sulfotransferase isoform X2 [Eurytemora carolleeae]|eukprot:XP_023339078.1 galactosylceramide sulfotransferase-like isoform X2 [Eurytemora affinis]
MKLRRPFQKLFMNSFTSEKKCVCYIWMFCLMITGIFSFSVQVWNNSANYTRNQQQVADDLVNCTKSNSCKQKIQNVMETACKPASKIAFAKVHKTGSSTLQNILLRNGLENDLNFALPESSWMFNSKKPFDIIEVSSLPWAHLGFDLFIFHSIWNYDEVKKILPSAIYITILRNPVDCYESNYVYMNLKNIFKMDINEFAKRKASRNVSRNLKLPIGKNQQLFDLGVPRDSLENNALVKEKIKEFDKQFDLVLIAEHFDEGLVLLADKLCWDLRDVRYLRQNARKLEFVSDISSESRSMLSNWLWADSLLYQHFLSKFNTEVSRFGKEKLEVEVERLRSMNKVLEQECVLEVADNTKLGSEYRMAAPTVEGYVIDETKPWCPKFGFSEPYFYELVKQKMYKRTDNSLNPITKKMGFASLSSQVKQNQQEKQQISTKTKMKKIRL